MKSRKLLLIYGLVLYFRPDLSLLNVEDSEMKQVLTGVEQCSIHFTTILAMNGMYPFHLKCGLSLSLNRRSRYGSALMEHMFIMIGDSFAFDCRWWLCQDKCRKYSKVLYKMCLFGTGCNRVNIDLNNRLFIFFKIKDCLEVVSKQQLNGKDLSFSVF